ncbi:MAG: hypothetical protein J7K13_01295 [Thermoplasmata archaeon]|nr:hypothetical protein [Thermoplasmata archaeon]
MGCHQKNPLEVKGIGGKIARNIDDEINSILSESREEFGILQIDIQKVIKNLERGKTLHNIAGEINKFINMPVRGKASLSKGNFNYMKERFSVEGEKIESKFEKMMDEEKLFTSYI